MLMSMHIFSEGKEYISAIRASKKIGYASDYIGQLYRAKKIPGELIGKTLYIDFESLIEHRKNRQLGKARKLVVREFPLQSTRVVEDMMILKDSNKNVLSYAKDDRPQLPQLSKKSRYVEPIWTSNFVDQAAAFSLALLIAVSVGFFTLEQTNPRVALEVEQEMENFRATGRDFLAALPANVKHSVFNILRNSELAAVSVSESAGGFYDYLVTGFNNLKEIALRKFFFAQAPITPPAASAKSSSEPMAVTEVRQSLAIDIIAIKDELKSELENYVRKQISLAEQPLVIYQSTPVYNTIALREEILQTDTRPTVTRQSDADANSHSSAITRLADGGTFTNSTLTNASISGTGGFSILTFTNATGTSATTTNLFSTNATFTNLTGTTLGLTDITFTNATGTNATTTNLYISGLASSTNLRANTSIIGNLTAYLATFTNALFNGSTTLQSFTATNATTTNFFSTTASSTNLFSSLLTVGGNGLVVDASRNVGIGTTSPQWLLNPFSATAPQLALSAGAGISQWVFRNAGGNLYIATTTIAGTATSSLSALTIDSNGNVGVASTSPMAGFAVATHCVTGDTRLRRRKKKKNGQYTYDEVMIKDVKEGDEIQSLDEKTGKLVWSKVNKLMYMGEKEIWKITTESGKTIRTTAEHPYLVNRNSDLIKHRTFAFIDLSNVFGGAESEKWEVDYRKLKRYLVTRYGVARAFVFGGTSNRPDRVELHEQLSRLGYEVLLVPTRRFSDGSSKADVDSRMTFEIMRLEKEYDKAIVLTGDGDFYWVLEYLLARKESTKLFGFAQRTAIDLKRLFGEHFADLSRLKPFLKVDKNENGVPVKDTPVFRATDAFDGSATGVLPSYQNTIPFVKDGVWTKVKAIKEGDYIAIKGENDQARYDKIVTIERLPEEQVYDIEVEGTHNFVGNDIIAHNTYLGGNLTVQGNTILANSTTTQATTTNLALTSLNANIPYAQANGSIVPLTIGANLTLTNGSLSSAPSFSFPFTTQTDWSTNNATSTILGFKAGFYSLASSTIGNNTTGSGLTILGGATTTNNFLVLGSTTLQAFSGTSGTTTNFYTGNLLVTGSSTLQNFTASNATTTSATSTNLYVSGLASTTELRANTGIISSLTSAFGTLTNLLVNGSSTLQNFTASNATTTQATTTNFALTSLSSVIPYAFSSGALGALTIGANLTLTNGSLAATGGSSFAWPFTKQADNSQGTTTVMSFLGGFYSSASSTLTDFIATNATTTSATTTNFYASGGVRTAGTYTSDIAIGTAPLVITSNTKVANLNADLLDGLDSSAFGDATAANQTTILTRIGTNADAASLASSLFGGQEYIGGKVDTINTNTDNAYSAVYVGGVKDTTANNSCDITIDGCISGWTDIGDITWVTPELNTNSGCVTTRNICALPR